MEANEQMRRFSTTEVGQRVGKPCLTITLHDSEAQDAVYANICYIISRNAFLKANHRAMIRKDDGDGGGSRNVELATPSYERSLARYSSLKRGSA
jgi:hypothetical protein